MKRVVLVNNKFLGFKEGYDGPREFVDVTDEKADEMLEMLGKEHNIFYINGEIVYKKDFAKEMKKIRDKRNEMISEYDHMFFKDTYDSYVVKYGQVYMDAVEAYRNELRDITSNLNAVEDLDSLAWPTKPGL